MATDSYNQIFGNKQTVMVVMAHPDDLEVFCGATVARLVADGKRVISVKITDGDKGTKESDVSPEEMARTRIEEDKASMKLLGIPPSDSIYLHHPDGAVENSLDIIGQIALQIRTFQPELIITTNPEHIIVTRKPGVHWVNHRDHRNAAACALDAAYPYSRDHAFFPEQLKDQAVKSGNCIEFLIADWWDGPDEVLINVDGFAETKQSALECHASQLTAESAKEYAQSFTAQDEATDGAYEKFRYIIAD